MGSFDAHKRISHCRVLVADDEPLSRAMVSKRLELLGAQIIEASSGSEAFALLMNGGVDAVILDLDMPDIDGFALLGCIRSHPKLRHLPVIVLSGLDDRGSIQKALEAGATSYLLKPLNWTAFGEHVRSVLLVAGQMVSNS